MMAARFDVVAIRIEHKRTVVVGVVADQSWDTAILNIAGVGFTTLQDCAVNCNTEALSP